MSGKALRVATLRRELGSGRSVPLRGDLRLQSIQRKPGWLGSCVKRPEQDDKVLVERQAGPGEEARPRTACWEVAFLSSVVRRSHWKLLSRATAPSGLF